MELKELHEKEVQREEMQKLMGQIHQLRSELQDTVAQHVSEAESQENSSEICKTKIPGHKTSKELKAE